MLNRLASQAAVAAILASLAFAAAPARAAEPTPAAVATATAILSEVGLKGSIQGVCLQMMGELERNLLQGHPELQAPLHETLVALAPEFLKGGEGVLNDVASVFASRMTEQELKDTKAFFDSPTGKKYLDAQDPIMRQLNASGAAWRAQLSSQMLTRTREELKKKGYSF